MNIVVLGAHGMAGHVISKYLKSQGHSVIDVARSGADISVDFEHRHSVDQMVQAEVVVQVVQVVQVELTVQAAQTEPVDQVVVVV